MNKMPQIVCISFTALFSVHEDRLFRSSKTISNYMAAGRKHQLKPLLEDPFPTEATNFYVALCFGLQYLLKRKGWCPI